MSLATMTRNYRGDKDSRFKIYGDVVSPSRNFVQFTIDSRYWFLWRKLHLINYINVAGSSIPLNYKVRIIDTSGDREFQNILLPSHDVGGNAHSPNVLPVPHLFAPLTTILLEFDRVPTRVHYGFEGEHIVNPNPEWVERMKRRSWYQFGTLSLGASTKTELKITDPQHDFAILRACSTEWATGVLANTNPGKVRIREIGPKGNYWSNDEVPNTDFAGVYGFAGGPRRFIPPIIIRTPTILEISTRGVPSTSLNDLVFDGIKFPKGTKLEEWL